MRFTAKHAKHTKSPQKSAETPEEPSAFSISSRPLPFVVHQLSTINSQLTAPSDL